MNAPNGGALCGQRVLVTGGTGFIGTHLVRRILREPVAEVVVLGRTEPAVRDPRLKFAYGSLQDLNRQFWADQRLRESDVVFHLGAFTPKSPQEVNAIDSVFISNVAGTMKLLDSLPQDPRACIFASTLDVYERPREGERINELSAVAPVSFYAASKLFCEQLLRETSRQRGFALSILRYGHVYGPGESAYAKLIPNAIRDMLAGRSPTVMGDGSAERDYLYVADAAEATVRAASTGSGTRTINVVSGTSHSVREVVATLRRLLKFERPIEFVRSASPQYALRFDDSLMRNALGSWERVEFQKGLQDEVDYFRESAP